MRPPEPHSIIARGADGNGGRLKYRVIVVLVIVCGCLGPTPAQASDEWPQYRGHASQSQTTSIPAGIPSLNLLWKQKVSGECHAGVAIRDGIVVMPDHGEGTDIISAMRLEDGGELWTYTYANTNHMQFNSAPRATPLIHGNAVYTMSAFGNTYCFELTTGALRWSHEQTTTPPTWGFCPSPLIYDGTLLLSGAEQSTALAAFDPANGKGLWKAQNTGPANYASFMAGHFGGKDQVIGYDEKTLGGWDLTTGQRLWTLTINSNDGYLCIPPVELNGALVLMSPAETTRLHRFNPDGTLTTTRDAESDAGFAETSAPTVYGDLVFVSGAALVCLDGKNGLRTLWSYEDKSLFGEIMVIASHDRLLAFCNGYVAVLRYDRNQVERLTSKKLCAPTYSLPAVSQGKLIVRDKTFVYCYDLGPAAD